MESVKYKNAEHQDLMSCVEQLIDKTTLAAVMTAIGNICLEKAEHIETTWQDKPLAKQWRHKHTQISRNDWSV